MNPGLPIFFLIDRTVSPNIGHTMFHRIAALKRHVVLPFALSLLVLALPVETSASDGSIRVVVLGSSTAEGANANPISNSWVNLYAAYLSTSIPGSEVVNLAVGGYTTFNIMPTGSIPPGSWNQAAYQPATGRNITAALALNPDLIIVNMPTNDCAVQVPLDVQMQNCAAIVREAAAHNVPVWITTSQPRNLSPAPLLLLRGLFQLTYEAFPDRAIDFWTGLADSSGYILPEYNSDGTHMNNAGHAVLFDRVVATVRTSHLADPSIAMHPRSRTIMEGDTTSFEVVGFGHDPLSYQWQRNGEDISGETDAVLTLNGAALADSGAVFSCIVSNGPAGVTSNGAELTVHALPGPPSTALRSDDFVTAALDTTVWQFTNPKNDATLSFTGAGTNDVWLTLQIPGGTAHDIWTGANEAPRILQPMANENFEVQVKFASVPAQQYQMQGIIIQKDSVNLVRFDVVRMSAMTHIFAASFVNGIPTVQKDSLLSGSAPLYLRLRRIGSRWTGSFSYDGTSWTTAVRFTFSISTTAAGVFAANSGDSPAATPPFTSQIDYFFNNAAPIDPEDLQPLPATPVPVQPVTGTTDLPLALDIVWTSTGDGMDSLVVASDAITWASPLTAIEVPAATHHYHLDGLLRGATYAWRVRTSYNGRWSPWSSPSTFSTEIPVLSLSRSPAIASRVFTPDTTWADAASDSLSDWSYGTGSLIPVFLRSEHAITFSACSMTVHWDPARLSYQNADFFGSLCAGAATRQTTVDTIQGLLTLTAAFSNTLSIIPGTDYLVRFNFACHAPGRATITSDPVRFVVPMGTAKTVIVARADTMFTSILLGDVASSGSMGSRADGRVDFEDLSAWSLSYWATRPATSTTTDGYRRKYDIGPTLDGTPYSLPVPDGVIDFEDMMIMALMYGTNETTPLPKTVQTEAASLALEAGDETGEGASTIIPVLLRGAVTDLHGLAIRLPGIAERLIDIAPGSILTSLTPGPIVFSRSIGQDVEVHVAAGAGRAIPMNGEIFRVRLRSSGPFAPEIKDARDRSNNRILATGVNAGGSDRPTTFALEQNYPNPFNPSTSIRYSVPTASPVLVRVYSLLGEEIATLVNDVRAAGHHQVVFDARGLPSGVYLCQMRTGSFTATTKLLLVR
jgi:lysophospholipase L1-like esterase